MVRKSGVTASVTTIGNWAFCECTNLTHVVIPDSAITIGEGAFKDCSGLTNIVIGSSVTTIGERMSYGCTNLTNVVIPHSVTNIGDWAFGYCSSLTNIAVAANNPSYTSLDGVLFNKGLTTLVQFPGGLGGSYAISNSVTHIGVSAFYRCHGLTEVVIPDSVTTIGGSLFQNCYGLTSIVIGSRVTIIGDWAFYRCTNLTHVVIPDSVTTIGDKAFELCDGLTNVVIGNGVTTIGEDAFWHCSGLTEVVIPDSVTTIGDEAFAYCSSLQEVHFYGNAPTVGSSVFKGATAGTVYYLAGTTGWEETFGGWPTAPSTIPASAVTFIDAFSDGLDPEWWTVVQSDGNIYTVDTSHGDVRLAKSTTTPGGVQYVMVRLYLQTMGGPVTGDFSVQVDFSDAVVPGPGLDQAELHTYYEDGSIYYAVYDNSDGSYNAHVWDGYSVLGAIRNLSVDAGTFRISRVGDTVTAYFNGTAMYSQTRVAPLVAVDFVLQNNAGSDDAISVTFDNFSLTAASIAPPLTIVPAGSSKVEVSWATNWTGFVLQQNTALGATPWTAVTNTPSVSGGRYAVPVETDGAARFFRLLMTE